MGQDESRTSGLGTKRPNPTLSEWSLDYLGLVTDGAQSYHSMIGIHLSYCDTPVNLCHRLKQILPNTNLIIFKWNKKNYLILFHIISKKRLLILEFEGALIGILFFVLLLELSKVYNCSYIYILYL